VRVWQEVPLGEVIERITGGKNIEAGSGTSAFRIMKVSAVTSGVFKPNEAKPAPDGHVPAPEHHVREADFLFSRANTSELVGAVAIAHNPPNGLLLPDKIWRIEWNCKRIYPRYAYYMLRSAELRRVLALISSGTSGSMKNISQAKLVRVLVPLPPLDEQQRIVELLERAAEIRRRTDAARTKARAIIPALFLDTFGDPATNPRGWPVVTVGEAGEVKLGRQRAPKYQSGKFKRPYVRVANVFESKIDVSDLLSMDFDERDFAAYRLSHGDVLLNEGQSIELVGRPAMWRDEVKDCCFQNTLVRFRCDPAKVVSEFALAAFLRMYNDGHLRKIASKTSNVAHLGAGRFAKLLIVLPPLPLQTTFAKQAKCLESLGRHLDAAAAKADAMAAGLSAEVFGSPSSPARRNAA
jgi:type I restriction enzyme S subunit